MLRQKCQGRFHWTYLLAFVLVAAVGVYAAPQAGGYHVIRKMTIGGDGAWDYLRVDSDAHRIYIARSSHVMVVDETTGKLITDIQDTKGVHGVAIVNELGRAYTSDGGSNSIKVLDLKTLKPISEINIEGGNPDAIIYDPMTKRLFTFNAKTHDSTVIDPASGKVVGTVALGGKPEGPVLDGKSNVFVNIEDKSNMVEFDAKTLAVKATWPVAPCEGPSPLSIDTVHRRLFVDCDKMMVVLNADTGKVVASLPISGDPDGNGFDPATGLLFASCEQGMLSIIHQDSPDKYRFVGNVPTKIGARTMAMDLKTHHVFTVSADYKPMTTRGRPIAIPGTFVILELGQ